VRDNGFSSADLKKMERQIAPVIDAFNVRAGLPLASVYTEKFLPPKADLIPHPYKE
jgi:hypothetical protein